MGERKQPGASTVDAEEPLWYPSFMLFLLCALSFGSEPVFTDPACVDGASCLEMGDKWRNGWGVNANAKRAADLWRRGCELGHQASCEQVASAYENGNGVPYNPATAATWTERANRLSPSPNAKDRVEREPQLRTACLNNDDAFACYRWTVPWRPSRPEGSPEYAVAPLEKACQLGMAMACRDLGKADATRETEGLERSCKAGNPYDCDQLIHNSADTERATWEALAFKNATADCRDDYHMDSCANLAFAHVNGQGVAKQGPGMNAPLLASCERAHGSACANAAKLIPAALAQHLGTLKTACDARAGSDECYAIAQMCSAQVPAACEIAAPLCKAGALVGAEVCTTF